MATYSDIPTSDRDAESPITESLIGRMIDNPEATANASAGTDEPPRVMCNATGASAIAALGASDGDFLRVTATTNPNTGQGGLVVRPVAGVGAVLTNSKSTTDTAAGAQTNVLTLSGMSSGVWAISATGTASRDDGSNETQVSCGTGYAIMTNDTLSGVALSFVDDAQTGFDPFTITKTASGEITFTIGRFQLGGANTLHMQTAIMATRIA